MEWKQEHLLMLLFNSILNFIELLVLCHKFTISRIQCFFPASRLHMLLLSQNYFICCFYYISKMYLGEEIAKHVFYDTKLKFYTCNKLSYKETNVV